MLVKTEPIKLGPVEKTESQRIENILVQNYGWEIEPGTLARFLEKTASSRVYQIKIKGLGLKVIKDSFWYGGQSEEEKRKSLAALEKAYKISEALRKKGVALPEVFLNKQGKFITQFESSYFTALDFLTGEHFSSRDEEFTASGAVLAFFHKKGAEYLLENPAEKETIEKLIPAEKPYEESRQMYENFLREDLLKPHQCGFPEVCRSFRENIEAIDETIKFIDSSGVLSPDLSNGILYNDFHTNNALFTPDGSFSGFLDIDQIGVGPFVWDLGNTLASFASNFLTRTPGADFEPKARFFLKAYHREFSLPLKEYELCLAATQRWDVMRILRTLRRHRYENNRLPELLPKVSDRLIPRIIAAPKVFSFITEDWLKRNLAD